MEACGNAAALRVPDSLAGVQLLPASGKAVSGHACPAAPSASTGSCGHEQQHGSPESDSAIGPEAVAAADAPGTPPAVAPAPTLCRSPRRAQAPNAAALFGLGACGSGSAVASGQYVPALVPLRGSAAPRVLLGYGAGALGSAWPALPLGACASASASARQPSPVPASLPAAAALAAGVAAPAAGLLGRGIAARPIVPSSLAAAVAIASGAPPAAPHDQALPLGSGLGFRPLPALPLAPPALPLGAMPDVWQLLGSSLACCGVPPPSVACCGVPGPSQGPTEDGFYLCRLGAADLARAGAEGAAARAAPAAQQGTTVAYVCQAIQLPPTGSSAPPLLPVKVLSAPAPAALGSLFAASAATASAAAAPPAAVLLPATELPAAPPPAGLLPAGLGRDSLTGFAALPAPASVGPAQGWPLTPSSSSAFCSIGSRLSAGAKSHSMPHALSAGPPMCVKPRAGPCAAVTCSGAAVAAPPGRPGGYPREEAGVSLCGRARRRHIAAREAPARGLGKGPVQGSAQVPHLEPCRASVALSARRGADSAVVHRPAKLRRLVPEATQLLLLSAAAGVLLEPVGVAHGAA